MEEVYKYIKDHSKGQNEALDWVERQTNLRTNHARMLSGAVQGQFLSMLVQMSGAKRILELGTFTGYSAICLASAMPEDGHLDTVELNDELEDIILGGFERAGVSERISLHIGDCKKILQQFITGSSEQGEAALNKLEDDSTAKQQSKVYDLVYIDANKREYCEYYSLVKQLLKPGGYIIADNVLWSGKVCENQLSKDAQTQGILKFNEMVVNDPEVENVIIPLRDGMNLIRLI